jgi:hypothetical protein
MLILDGEAERVENLRNTTLRSISEGEHTLGLWVVDEAGNWNLTETTFIIDLTSPEVIITRPSDGLYTLNRTINATWTIVENGAGADITIVKLDEGNWTTVTSGNYLLENLAPGTHTFSVKCADLAGNIGEGTVSFEIFEDEIPPETRTVNGFVTNENGDPIEGVKVKSDEGNETKTDSDGWFNLVVQKGFRTLTFKKSGYRTFTKNVDANENITIEKGNITLEKKDEEERSPFLRNLCICLCGVPLGLVILAILVGFIKRAVKGKKDHPRYEE